ncbi:MAG: hypothetical protein Q8S13_00130, partial [Dehalococcoidia bacterium]|nr:hypothetical protein [Dehalococcoidia bacterium]
MSNPWNQAGNWYLASNHMVIAGPFATRQLAVEARTAILSVGNGPHFIQTARLDPDARGVCRRCRMDAKYTDGADPARVDFVPLSEQFVYKI